MLSRARSIRIPWVVLLVIIVTLSLTSCHVSTSPETGENAAIQPSDDVERADVIPISIRNSTAQGGLASSAGEKLKQEGYLFEEGYTIDIGNAQRNEYPESFIWVPKGNEPLHAIALELHSVLDFEVVSDDELLGVNEKANEEGILIVLGNADVGTGAFNGFTDSVRYPPISGTDKTTVFQMEPFDTAEAKRLDDAAASKPMPKQDEANKLNEFGTEIVGEPSSSAVSIVVRNSSGVDGAAAVAAEALRAEGYRIDIAAKPFYPGGATESVIFYHDKEGLEEIAYRIAELIGTDEVKLLGHDWHADYLGEDITVSVNVEWVNAHMLEEGQSPYTKPS